MEKSKLKINIGGSAIILIIVVFALSIFAILSIKASNSDLKLAKRTRTSIEQYYIADSKAEELLSNLQECMQKYKMGNLHEPLKNALQAKSKKIRLVAENDKRGTITYQININKYASLQVCLYYDMEQDINKICQIKTWKVQQKDMGDYNFANFEFWDGTIKDENSE